MAASIDAFGLLIAVKPHIEFARTCLVSAYARLCMYLRVCCVYLRLCCVYLRVCCVSARMLCVPARIRVDFLGDLMMMMTSESRACAPPCSLQASVNPGVRTAAVSAIVTMHQHVGPTILALLEGEKPAVLTIIAEKVKEVRPDSAVAAVARMRQHE